VTTFAWAASAEETRGNTMLNLLICHEDQDSSELYTPNTTAHDLPENHVSVLAENRKVMARYLLPNLIQKVQWTEREMDVVLIGTRVVVPMIHRHPTRPVAQQVERGEIVIGATIAESVGLKKEDVLRFKGRTFKVREIHPRRGTVDDRTMWVALSEAQEILERKGRISLIQVLECNCAWADVDEIKIELKKTMDKIRIVEF